MPHITSIYCYQILQFQCLCITDGIQYPTYTFSIKRKLSTFTSIPMPLHYQWYCYSNIAILHLHAQRLKESCKTFRCFASLNLFPCNTSTPMICIPNGIWYLTYTFRIKRKLSDNLDALHHLISFISNTLILIF